MIADFTKIVRIGTTMQGWPERQVSTFCNIKWRTISGGRQELSITGVEGPTRNGDAYGSCGQIVMHGWAIVSYAPGWDADKVTKFRAIWDEWHLNTTSAGSPRQNEFLKQYMKGNPDFRYDYPVVVKLLEEAGLSPDTEHEHEGKPYRYGHAWLYREVPEDVINWLQALPDTDKTPAWV